MRLTATSNPEQLRAPSRRMRSNATHARRSAVEFVEEWRDKCYSEQGSWDQNLFASTLRRAGELTHEELQLTPERLRPMYRTKLGR